MFFDECYSEHYYRINTVNDFVEESDCLIVVGTALATNLALQIVNIFRYRGLPIIEINLESAINKGNNIQVLQGSETALPEMFQEYYRLKAQSQQVQQEPVEEEKKLEEEVKKLEEEEKKPEEVEEVKVSVPSQSEP